MTSDATKRFVAQLFNVLIIFSTSFLGILAGMGAAQGLGVTAHATDPIGAAFGAGIISLYKAFLFLARLRGLEQQL